MTKILIVDDEKFIRLGIEIILKREFADKFDIMNARNGEEAIELIEGNKIDILITDIKMPKMDGIEMIKNLYKKNALPICIVVSGYGNFEYAQSCIEFGVKNYLLKPIERKKLIEVIKGIVKELKRELKKEDIEEKIYKIDESASKLEEEYIDMAKEYIQKNYYRDLNMAVVSNYISLSYSYFSTIFNRYLNMKFSDYLNYIRVQESKKLLKRCDYKIYEISEKVGYKNSKHFMKMFKKFEKRSPSQYRIEILNKDKTKGVE